MQIDSIGFFLCYKYNSQKDGLFQNKAQSQNNRYKYTPITEDTTPKLILVVW